MRIFISEHVRKLLYRFCLFMALLCLTGLSAQSQNVVTGQSRDDLELPKPRTETFSDKAIVEQPKSAAQPCPFDGTDLTVALTGIDYVFSDGTPLSGDILKALAPITYTNEETSLSVVCDIRDQVNSRLQSEGWIALARIPQQNLVDRLKLEIVSAKITDVRVLGDVGPYAKLIAKHLKPLRQSPSLNRFDVDKALVQINDTPGLDVRMQVTPIQGRPGEVAGNLIAQYKPYNIILNTRNYASEVNGRESVLARFEYYGLTNSADLSYIAAQSDWGFNRQQILQAGHEFGVGTKGLRLGTDVTFSKTRPDIEGLDLTSEALLIGINARYPLLRTPRTAVGVELGFDYADQSTDVGETAFSEDSLRTIYLRTDWAGRGFQGVGYRPPSYQGSLELRKGLDIFSATDSAVSYTHLTLPTTPYV